MPSPHFWWAIYVTINDVKNMYIYHCYSTVPMFAHVLQQWRKIYYGFCIGGGFRTAFQISQLRRIPSQFQHLAGLLEIFKDKLVSTI